MNSTDSAPAAALPSVYSPAAVETRLYERWVAQGYFGADAGSQRPPYTIVLPPPNVTGQLHMGHALNHTVMDLLTRWRRMQGYETLWLPGMDHAGIATQNVVERELAKEGISRHDLGREAFVQRVWQWKSEYGGKILGQMRRLGDGVDWSRERFTMDDGLSRAVGTIFKRLYDDGLIYRAERIINWCPRCLTALSDIEVEHSDDDGELVSICYGPITVATTRVETMLGDTAVAVHPDDERYAHLVGTEIELPLTGAAHPDRRRRACRSRVRHRRGQGDPGPRPERLRDRPAPRAAVDHRHGRARRHHRARSVRGPRPVRGPAGRDGGAARAGAHRRREASVRARGRALFALRHRRRAAAVAAVVREGRVARQGGR